MDETRRAAVVLAALEQVPGEPSDLTRVLRDPLERQILFSDDHDHDGWGIHGSLETEARRPGTGTPRPTPLVQYLVEVLDQGRVEHWAKTIDRGVRDERYRCYVVGDDDYPARLNSAWDAPPIIFSNPYPRTAAASSSRDEATTPALAIIGGRETTADVLVATRAVALRVAEQGVDVVSGLAAGVDTAAHLAALEADGATTAVLGTGIERVFPEANAELARTIAQHGTVLSQFVPHAPRTGTTFLRRNSVIAAISDASLIMDGRARSGSRHEIEQAIRYGRRVLMWRPALGSADWALRLESNGFARFVGSPEEVLGVLQ